MLNEIRIQEKKIKQNVVVSQSESEEQSVEQIKFKANLKKEFRQRKLSLVKEHVDSLNETTERKEENTLIYFVNLIVPIILTILIVNIFMNIEEAQQIKALIFLTLNVFGAVFSFYSCTLLAPWRQFLKIYFMIDSMLPIIICGTIAYYYMMDFFDFSQWWNKLYGLGYPIWTIYLSGNIRVHIRYVRWKKWQIILLKLSILFCGLGIFYIGIKYMNGAYKVTQGCFESIQDQLRNLILLFIFVAVEIFFQMYRKLTNYDQTDQLLYEYVFAEKVDQSQKEASQMEYQNIRRQSLQEQIQNKNLEFKPISRLKEQENTENKNRTQ